MGTALAAFQLAPFLAWTESLDLSGRVFTIHLPLRVLATFVVPNAFGSPVDGIYYGPMNYVEIGPFIKWRIPFSDMPRFGPMSKKGRHQDPSKDTFGPPLFPS